MQTYTASSMQSALRVLEDCETGCGETLCTEASTEGLRVDNTKL